MFLFYMFFFNSLFNELKYFKKRKSKLPWKVTTVIQKIHVN
jgi:hypothetical protein